MANLSELRTYGTTPEEQIEDAKRLGNAVEYVMEHEPTEDPARYKAEALEVAAGSVHLTEIVYRMLRERALEDLFGSLLGGQGGGNGPAGGLAVLVGGNRGASDGTTGISLADLLSGQDGPFPTDGPYGLMEAGPRGLSAVPPADLERTIAGIRACDCGADHEAMIENLVSITEAARSAEAAAEVADDLPQTGS